jgi:hypothetical protein
MKESYTNTDKLIENNQFINNYRGINMPNVKVKNNTTRKQSEGINPAKQSDKSCHFSKAKISPP